MNIRYIRICILVIAFFSTKSQSQETLPIYTDHQGHTRCALVCAGLASGICAPGAHCMTISGKNEPEIGVCLYKKSKIELPAI